MKNIDTETLWKPHGIWHGEVCTALIEGRIFAWHGELGWLQRERLCGERGSESDTQQHRTEGFGEWQHGIFLSTEFFFNNLQKVLDSHLTSVPIFVVDLQIIRNSWNIHIEHNNNELHYS
jgi:hypothetical protein